MSILNRLFCDFLVPDSLFVMLFLLGSFALGLLLGWRLWGDKIKKAIADLAASNTLVSSLQSELTSLKDKMSLRDADLAKSGKDMEDLRVAFRGIQSEKGQTDAYYMTATNDLAAANDLIGDLRLQLEASITATDQANEALAAALSAATLSNGSRSVDSISSESADDTPITEVYEEEAELRSFHTIVEETSPTEEIIAEAAPSEDLLVVDTTPEILIAPETEIVAEEPAAEETATEETTVEIQRSVEPINEFVALDAVFDEPLISGGVTEEVTDEPIAEPKEAAKTETIIETVPVAVIEKEAPVLVPPAGIRLNDLKVIEGIGPKVSGLLHENGIYTWAALAATTPEALKEILTKGGERFRLQKPDTWPEQAAMLAEGNWSRFKEYTQFLVAGLDPKGGAAFVPKEDSRRRLYISPKGWRSDDLKVIEGIGPKIEQLIKDGGIGFWAELADATPARLREILAGGGERFQMHDPTTWPDQARLLTNENWDKFEEFVKYLNRGRTPHD